MIWSVQALKALKRAISDAAEPSCTPHQSRPRRGPKSSILSMAMYSTSALSLEQETPISPGRPTRNFRQSLSWPIHILCKSILHILRKETTPLPVKNARYLLDKPSRECFRYILHMNVSRVEIAVSQDELFCIAARKHLYSILQISSGGRVLFAKLRNLVGVEIGFSRKRCTKSV